MKIVILGTGAQGSTVAQRMDEEPNVEEILCADYDIKAAEKLASELTKGKAVKVDASSADDVKAVCAGYDLVVNALPLAFGKNALEAALAAKANYQDFAAPEEIAPPGGEDQWVEGIHLLFSEYAGRFAEIGKLAVVGTGSAPGLICAATRRAVRELDSCDTIYNNCYEGVEVKRFQPFWWSPVTALSDMSEEAYALIDGKLVRTPAFGLPIFRKYDYLDEEVRMVEHCHDEPVFYSLHADSHLKGVKNAYFKYGGVGIDFSEPLSRAGLLSKEEETIKGRTVVPFDVVLAHLPPAPKTREEIGELIDEGIVSDTGAMVVEAIGKKNGKDVRVEVHVMAPGLVDSYNRAGISAEMYLTGQAGSLFTQLFARGLYEQSGLITTDMLTDTEIDHYFDSAAKLDINLEIKTIEL